MTQQLILGLDIGTSSVRAALYNDRGEMIPETFVKNDRSLDTTREGGFEIDADVALKQTIAAVDDVLARAANVRGEISHVASCAFWHSLVGVDREGRASTKVLGWADTRSRNCTRMLRKRFDETLIHNRTGAPFHSSFWPAKLLWLRLEDPGAFARTSKWLSLSDFVAFRLSGAATTSISMASATGVFDIRRCVWDADLLRFLKIKISGLPPIDPDPFQLSAKFGRRWPRLKNTRWFPAIGDGAANNIGAGCLNISRAALMVGTSGAMRVAYRGEPPVQIPSGLWCYRIDGRRIVLGGALSDGGGLYRWLKEKLKIDNEAALEREIERRRPDQHGLTFLPFFAGERSTGYNEDARGAIIGIVSSTDATDIIHAALESVAYRFAEILDQLMAVIRVREIVASGGALRSSAVWTRIIADVLGRDLTLPDTREASMRGAVLLALETIGKIEKLEEIATPVGQHFRSDKTHKSRYSAARRRHQDAYRSLIDHTDT